MRRRSSAGLVETLGIYDPHHAWECFAVNKSSEPPRSKLNCIVNDDNDLVKHATTVLEENRYYNYPHGGITKPNRYLKYIAEDRTPSMQFIIIGAEVLLIDPQGRRVGYDIATGEFVQEIPNSTYFDAEIVPPGAISNDIVERTLLVSENADGDYLLQVIGLAGNTKSVNAQTETEFIFSLLGYDNQFNMLESGATGSVSPGEIIEYNISYEPDQGLSVNLVPPSLIISGPTTGTVNTPYTFTTTITPSVGTALLPITYTWQATGQITETHTGAGLGDTNSFTWNSPGNQVITVTATNQQNIFTGSLVIGDVLSDTHIITITAAPPQPPTDVVIDGLVNGLVDTNYTFTALVNPVTTTQPITYHWQATGQSEVMTATNALSHTTSFTWDSPGTKTISVTATNSGGAVTNTHRITINASSEPVIDVTIDGIMTGLIQSDYTFTATVSPMTATQPITYRWQAGEQAEETHTDQGETDSIILSWNLPGTQVITVTATNNGGFAVQTHTVTINAISPDNVIINGPTTGGINTAYTFTATVSPITASLPMTYTWSPPPDDGQGMSLVTYTWATTDTKTIGVTATNVGGTVSSTHIIMIDVAIRRVYLPLILKP